MFLLKGLKQQLVDMLQCIFFPVNVIYDNNNTVLEKWRKGLNQEDKAESLFLSKHSGMIKM